MIDVGRTVGVIVGTAEKGATGELQAARLADVREVASYLNRYPPPRLRCRSSRTLYPPSAEDPLVATPRLSSP